MRHILSEIDFIFRYTAGKVKTEVIADEVLQRAIIRSLEIIGEATKKIDENFKLSYPLIEWKKMAGTRDRLIHDYFGVDYDIVWNIIEEKLPGLQSDIRTMLDQKK